MKSKVEHICKAVKKSKKVAIMGHKDGDGDYYGSAFALSLGLEKIGKHNYIVSNEDLPDNLEFLFSFYNGEISSVLESDVDLLIVLDCSDKKRTVMPEVVDLFKLKEIVLIDHHTKGDLLRLADVSWVNSSFCSASEMVFHLLKELDVEIDKNIATCLLTGIETDTSSFQNQNTTKECFFVASELMARGARLKTIISNTFGGKPIDNLKIWGLAIDRIRMNKRINAIISYLTYEDMKKYEISGEALSGIANFLNSIKGAKIFVFLTEEEKGIIRVSLRTRDDNVDVSVLAKLLGGGGHVKASGFTVHGSIKKSGEATFIV